MGKKLRILADSLSEYLAENYQKVGNLKWSDITTFKVCILAPLKK